MWRPQKKFYAPLGRNPGSATEPDCDRYFSNRLPDTSYSTAWRYQGTQDRALYFERPRQILISPISGV
jgi:hypothetical protein